MPKRESFLLRMDPTVMEALRRWADDELRSVNGQIEYLLRAALAQRGRPAGKGSSRNVRNAKRGH